MNNMNILETLGKLISSEKARITTSQQQNIEPKENLPSTSVNIGKKVLIRTYSAGDCYGTLDECVGTYTRVSNARMIHYWEDGKAISLFNIAVNGLSAGNTRMTPACKLPTEFTQTITIFPLSDEVVAKLDAIPNHLNPDSE